MNREKKISIVIPVYNEEKNIPILYSHLIALMKKINSYTYEIIFINDGSQDTSWTVLENLPATFIITKAINLSRNFGHQIALSAGYHHATGDAIISMDADMQHPPEVIPTMIQAWQEGFDIVYVQNMQRKDTFFKKITALGYYRFLEMLSDVKIPRNVADFRLIDKKVLNFINQSQEKSRYLRGMVAWSGFKHTFIPCRFAPRLSGKTGYTWSKMFKLAFDGMTGFSASPVRPVAYGSLLVMSSGILMLSYALINTCLYNGAYPLFKWLIIIIYLSIGLQFFLIWLLSEYIGALYEQTKQRPLYIITEKVNCD